MTRYMKHTDYYKSGLLSINARNNMEAGRNTQQLQKLERIAKYEQTPSVCANCGTVHPYHIRKNKFCSSSCAATYNNTKRVAAGWTRSEESKQQTSAKLKGRANKHKGKSFTKVIKIFYIECKICGIKKCVSAKHRKHQTCGNTDCMIQASVGIRPYQNGSRKPVWFYNPNEDKLVLLDSSWEVVVANHLINLGVVWERPVFIKWVDNTGKTRRYFPDFYLPQYNMYLDPKNPYCMSLDIEKMSRVSKIIPLIYGDIKIILNWIDTNCID